MISRFHLLGVDGTLEIATDSMHISIEATAEGPHCVAVVDLTPEQARRFAAALVSSADVVDPPR